MSEYLCWERGRGERVKQNRRSQAAVVKTKHSCDKTRCRIPSAHAALGCQQPGPCRVVDAAVVEASIRRKSISLRVHRASACGQTLCGCRVWLLCRVVLVLLCVWMHLGACEPRPDWAVASNLGPRGHPPPKRSERRHTSHFKGRPDFESPVEGLEQLERRLARPGCASSPCLCMHALLPLFMTHVYLTGQHPSVLTTGKAITSVS